MNDLTYTLIKASIAVPIIIGGGVLFLVGTKNDIGLSIIGFLIACCGVAIMEAKQ